MIQYITTPTGKEIIVEDVPKFYSVYIEKTLNRLIFRARRETLTPQYSKPLPEGDWKKLECLNDLTDEDCEPLVEREWDGTAYWYTDYINSAIMLKRKPKESFISFLLSKHINVEYNHLILMK